MLKELAMPYLIFGMILVVLVVAALIHQSRERHAH